MNVIAKRLQKLELRFVQEAAQASALLDLLEHRRTIWLARKGHSQRRSSKSFSVGGSAPRWLTVPTDNTS